jgi:hypothetical protein
MASIRVGSTDVLNISKHPYHLANGGERGRTAENGGDFFGKITHSSTEQYDTGELAGEPLRIDIRTRSPSIFSMV